MENASVPISSKSMKREPDSVCDEQYTVLLPLNLDPISSQCNLIPLGAALLTYFISSVLMCVSDTVGNMALILATDCSVSDVIEVSVARAGEA
jgi:hypothetical protein